MPPSQAIAGFTGTREGLSAFQRENLFNFLTASRPYGLHHGDCVGADEEAHGIASMLSIPVVVHPPSSKKFRAFCGKKKGMLPQPLVSWHHCKPYLERNRNIVDSATYLIACPKENQRPQAMGGGTWYTVDYALKQVVSPVYLFYPDGRVDRRVGAM
jgi:hypothetical protein